MAESASSKRPRLTSANSSRSSKQMTLTELFSRQSTSGGSRTNASNSGNESTVIEIDSEAEEKEVIVDDINSSDSSCSHVSESPPPLTLLIDKCSPTPPTWSCSPLSEICFGPSATPTLPPLRSSPTHCVTINSAIRPGTVPTPVPAAFKDIWDENHVRMPCSSKCLYPVGPPGSSRLENKWHLVKKALTAPIADSLELERAILSYNTRFEGKWKFRVLHCYFAEYASDEVRRHFFTTVLPQMVTLALSLPQLVTHAVPLLRKQDPYSLTLSQQQVACLLANAFFCTFPRRNTTAPGSEYASFPNINFNTLFCARPIDGKKINKLRCLLHYFERVTSCTPTGTLTFSRQVLSSPPIWEQCTQPFSKLHVTSDGTIEDDGHGMLQVDFANKYIGGGVIGLGCVQEEIRFLICPELIVSRLFTEELDANESLLMIGAEQYSTYKGYAATFEWGRDFVDETVSDEWGRKQVHIVAIDALIFRSTPAQFQRASLERELNKAYCGFAGDGTTTPCGRLTAVATGNWGCGAFGGNPHLKALLQWMACSVAGRDVVYFTFDRGDLLEDLKSFHDLIIPNGVTVSNLWHALNEYHVEVLKRRKKVSLLHYLASKFSQ